MTIFQKIINGEIPCNKVFEDDLCIAFKDINPQAPLHVLVVPKKLISKVSEAAAEDEPLLGHLLYVAGKVAKDNGYADFRLVINNGEGAGQTVPHLHIHVLAGFGATEKILA